METNKQSATSLSGTQKQDFSSLSEAQKSDNGYVVLEGHNGGLVYLVVPASQVKCSEDILINLLFDLADITFTGNPSVLSQEPVGREGFDDPGNDCDILYVTASLGDHVSGSIEHYGIATDGLHLHKSLLKHRGLEENIRAVLSGQKKRID